jgi:phage/plasmid-like protein (TIGR03299 family)
MSKYSLDYLSTHTLVGDVEVNGMPWTANCLGVDSTNHKNSDGRKWLWDSAIPVKRAKEFLDGFAVESFESGFIRPLRDGDTGPQFLMGDQWMTFVTDSDRQAVADSIRDRIHFVPKAGYVIHPFTETLLNRTARIVEESTGDLHIDSVGVLADGAEGWVSIATGDLLNTPEGVQFYPHVLASSSHSGTLATSLQAVQTMTVCDNTRTAALGEGRTNGTVTKARHSKRSEARLSADESEARTVLGLIETSSEEFTAQVKQLCEMTVTDVQWGKFLDTLAPVSDDMAKGAITRAENFRDAVSDIYLRDARNIWQGTAFGALQAVNTFDMWERGAWAGTDVALRGMREVITGKANDRESERRSALMSVLV